jgi:hypothetical protein
MLVRSTFVEAALLKYTANCIAIFNRVNAANYKCHAAPDKFTTKLNTCPSKRRIDKFVFL